MAGKYFDNMPRILSIDYGTRRLGLAISDETGQFAFGLETVHVQSDADAVAAIIKIARGYDPPVTRMVLGMPILQSGSTNPMAETVKCFQSQLESAGFMVRVYDERYSSAIAERVLLAADVSRAKRKAVKDKMAAQIILRDVLDNEAFVRGWDAGPKDSQ